MGKSGFLTSTPTTRSENSYFGTTVGNAKSVVPDKTCRSTISNCAGCHEGPNQLINVAVAEKVSALRTEEYFRERGRRGNRAETLRILERAGKGTPALEGDELPQEWQKQPGRKVANGSIRPVSAGKRKGRC